jgi:hypothetical protein
MTPGKLKRMRIFRHNGFQVSLRRAELCVYDIQHCMTATSEAKETARRIQNDLLLLREQLKQRIDPK